MNHVTPFRLIGVALVLGIVGGGFVGLTFSVHGGAVFVMFLIGNTLLGLAGLAGFLGLFSLAVEIGVRAAARAQGGRRPERPPASPELPISTA